MKMKVFLAGTEGGDWRKQFDAIEHHEFFIPELNLNPEYLEKENIARSNADVILHVLTPRSVCFQEVAEVVESACTRPLQTVCSVMCTDEDEEFTDQQLDSLSAVADIIVSKGGLYVPFEDLVSWFQELKNTLPF